MVVFFWLIGYGIFFRYVVGRLMFGFLVRDFLVQQANQRHNPLRVLTLFCPQFVAADFIYLEGFLFTVEFLILTWLVVKFFAPVVDLAKLKVNFQLLSKTNHYQAEQNEKIYPATNTFRLLTEERSFLFFSFQLEDLNLLTEKTLDALFQPYNQQTWLIQVFESFFPLLQQLATTELQNAQLADE